MRIALTGFVIFNIGCRAEEYCQNGGDPAADCQTDQQALQGVVDASFDIDGDGIDDLEQAVIAAPGGTFLYAAAQAPETVEVAQEYRGYGGGTYETVESNWTEGAFTFSPVYVDGVLTWYGARNIRPGVYRGNAAMPSAVVGSPNGWTGHSIGARAEFGDFDWLYFVNEGQEGCYRTSWNIAFGFDAEGYPFQPVAGDIGEPDNGCY